MTDQPDRRLSANRRTPQQEVRHLRKAMAELAEVNRFCACGDCHFCYDASTVELTKAEMNDLCNLLERAAKLAELHEAWKVAKVALANDRAEHYGSTSASFIGKAQSAEIALLAFESGQEEG